MRNLLALISLPLLIGGCVGNDETGSPADDSNVAEGIVGTILVTLPLGAPEDTQVTIGGEAGGIRAVVDCDGGECEAFHALEAETYLVLAQATGYYFAEMKVAMYADIPAEDQVAEITWQTGGCEIADWTIESGECVDLDSGKSLWIDGQWGCDVTGYWKGVEDEVTDIRGDIVMITSDWDLDGNVEASIEGGADKEDLFGFNRLNVSKARFGRVTEDSSWTVAEMANGSCQDGLIRVIDNLGEYHMELVQ